MTLLNPALPTHPRTGLSAAGIVNGRPVWPILGASEDGGDGGEGDGKSTGTSTSTWTPPASQDELDRIVQDRLSRAQKQYGMSADEAKAFKARVEALEGDLASETEKAVKAARDEASAKALETLAPNLVRQAFRAEAKGVLDKDQLDGLLEDYNAKNYLNDDGTVDEEKVAARVAKFAGKKAEDKKQQHQFRPLGQGHQTQAQPSARDLGRAEAEKRFGKKQ